MLSIGNKFRRKIIKFSYIQKYENTKSVITHKFIITSEEKKNKHTPCQLSIQTLIPKQVEPYRRNL